MPLERQVRVVRSHRESWTHCWSLWSPRALRWPILLPCQNLLPKLALRLSTTEYYCAHFSLSFLFVSPPKRGSWFHFVRDRCFMWCGGCFCGCLVVCVCAWWVVVQPKVA